MASVSVRDHLVTIPTYPIGEAEKNPIFYSHRVYQGARGQVYPYPFLDKLTDSKVDRRWRSVELENEYVSLSILPEIGGRLLSGRDKTNGYDFIYRQGVIRPALIGMLGAWISGGVEWNIPHHHRPTTFMPVDVATERRADGGATVWLSEIERRHRMKWLLGVTLLPGRSTLEITVKAVNRTPYAWSMLYFTNWATHVNPRYRIIFPPSTEWGSQHAKHEFIAWPTGDGVYNSTDLKGVDLTVWGNHPHWISIFTIESPDDFFGGYDVAKDAGTVHVADHHVVPGKKFWTFANGAPGWAWDKILTDKDGPYLELMAGSYSDNQPDYSWIEPYETRMSTEWWYPVRGLGDGFTSATVDAAVNLQITGNGSTRKAVASFSATRDLPGATAVLKCGDAALLERRVNVSPATPFSVEAPVPQGRTEYDLRVALYDDGGRELVSYQPRPRKGQPRPKAVVPPVAPAEMKTTEDLYLAALRLEQFNNPALDPDPYYEEAFKRSPDDYRVNTALGLLYLKRLRISDAEAHLAAAVARVTANHTRPKDGEALYYLGVARRLLGLRDEARDALNRAAWCFAWRAAAHMQLAEMAFEDGDLAGALASVEHSLAHNAWNTKALCLKSALLRVSGRPADALDASSVALAIDPLDHLAANGRALALAALGDKGAEAAFAALEENMRGELQSYLELAFDYVGWGRLDDAIHILRRFLDLAPVDAPGIAMVRYTLAWLYDRKGDSALASEERRAAAALSPDYVFPWRIEEMAALRSAAEREPADAMARYYLGNLLYDRQPREAIAAWQDARRLGKPFATLERNLGFAYAHVENDDRKAIEYLRRAFDLDPNDPRVLIELDERLAAAGAPHAERLALLESHPKVVARRDDLNLHLAAIYNLLGRFDDSLAVLDNRHFHVWEGAEAGAHDIFVDACVLRGRRRLAAGDSTAALADFESALTYPDRFERGRPYDGGREPLALYHAGLALDSLGSHDDARKRYEAAIEKSKAGTPLAYWQGLALRKLAREADAAKTFDALADAGAKLAAGAPVDFFDKFGGALTEAARRAEGHFFVGLALLGKGDSAGARENLRQAVLLNPNHLWACEMSAEVG